MITLFNIMLLTEDWDNVARQMYDLKPLVFIAFIGFLFLTTSLRVDGTYFQPITQHVDLNFSTTLQKMSAEIYSSSATCSDLQNERDTHL